MSHHDESQIPAVRRASCLSPDAHVAGVTTWFVSRHPGAIEWMREHGPAFDRHVAHLDPSEVKAGDCVVGTLPIHLAAQVCARGAAYWHLSLSVPQSARGQELSAQELSRLGAELQQFQIQAC